MKKLFFRLITAVSLIIVENYCYACDKTYTIDNSVSWSVGTISITRTTIPAGREDDYTGRDATTLLSISGNLDVFGKLYLSHCLAVNGSGDDIIVEAGGTLQIDESQFNFAGSKIVVMPGGKLIIENGTILKMNPGGTHPNQIIAIESDYVNFSDPEEGGKLIIRGYNHPKTGLPVSSQITAEGSGFRGISISGGNGFGASGTSLRGIGPTQHFSQYARGCKVYPAQLLCAAGSFSNMTEGIFNFDRFGTEPGRFDDPFGTGSTGGIIEINNATFVNNTYNSLTFRGYYNWLGGSSDISYPFTFPANLAKDRSFIRNSDFHTGTTRPSAYIYLTSLNGVSILGCTFEGGPTSYPPYTAIRAEGATITVDQACNDPYTPWSTHTGCSSVSNSTFKEQYNGIFCYAGMGNLIENNRIWGSGMTTLGNYGTGIDMEYSMNDIVVNNNIHNSHSSAYGAPTVTGLAAEGCSGYWIEGNQLDVISGSTDDTYTGIVINESGAAQNKLYRNVISNMDFGAQANGLNYSSLDHTIGFRLLCNDMSINTTSTTTATDALIGQIPGGPFSSAFGIAAYQGEKIGSTDYSAENAFASGKTSSTAYQIYNQSIISLDYRYNNSDAAPPSSSKTSSTVTLNTGSITTCPDNTAYASLSYTSTTIPTDAYKTMSQYMILKTGLETIINSTCSTSSTYPLLLRHYAELIDTMINSFLHAGDSLAQFKGDSSFWQNDGVDTLYDSVSNTYYYDTTISSLDTPVALNYDSLIIVLDSAKYLWDYKLRLASLYRQMGDMDNAITTLNNISSHYSLSSYEQRDVNNIIYLYSIEDSLWKKGRQYDSLSSGDTTLIRSIAADSIGKARYIARGILSMYDSGLYLPDINTVIDTSGGGNKPAAPIAQTINTIHIQPNPADLVLNITGAMGAKTELYDMTGAKVYEYVINTNSYIMDVSQILPGIYFVKILQNGGQVELDKIVITHGR